ncbi:hypothetical protein EIP86_004395 [Pleurotus ostreatoroseus]|nr:hypothetical protein EIP86_004395 [Pleurotus ostreatoroseus]
MSLLGLPPRSRESYMSLFEGSVTSSPQSPGTNPYDKRYSGEILVSGYQVSYVLPKEFPPRVYESDKYSKRSANDLHFMAVVKLWVPYLSTPPYSPYHLSLPVPKCLSNNIRLRIFPPQAPAMTSSMASLSSAEGDTNSWEFRVEPHVVTKPMKQLTRNNSYNSFADDESSDASDSRSNGYAVRGSFPSTDRLRISWATPRKTEDVPVTIDGRSRVGIRNVKSDITCSVLRRDKGKVRGRRGSSEGGVAMKVDYTATCRGVWFPGVATLLGMDLALDAGDCDVSWAPDGDRYWTVVGTTGYTGFSVGPQPKPSSQKSVEDAPPIRISPSSPEKQKGSSIPTRLSNAEAASRSTASLLRAPLPSSPHPDELSFDESPHVTPVSSVGSFATLSSERGRSRASSAARGGLHTDSEAEEDVAQRPPKVPITIHLNMDELGPPSKNEITISVSGTIMLRPRENSDAMFSTSPISSDSIDSGDDQEVSSAVLPIPQLHVLYTDREAISTILLNESDRLSVDIYNSTGNIADAQSRKTVLQPGSKTKCGADGGRFSLRTAPSNRSFLRRQDSMDSMRRTPSRPRTPSYLPRNTSTSSLYRDRSYSTKPRRDGPLMIPSVSATIKPLMSDKGNLPTQYAVHLQLPAPSEADSEWLEFGLAQPPVSTSSGPKSLSSHGKEKEKQPPRVQVASASVDGVPVKFETSAAARPDSKLPALGLTFEETSAKEWITWVKIHVGDTGGGNVQVVYLVHADEILADLPEPTGWKKLTSKGKSRSQANLDVLLPTFSLPVGNMEVNVESLPDIEYDVTSNLAHQQTNSSGPRLLKYSLEEFFYPHLTLMMSTETLPKHTPTSSSWRMVGIVLCMMPSLIAILALYEQSATSAALAQAHESLESCSRALQLPVEVPEPVTFTSISTVTTTTTTLTATTLTSTVYATSSAQAKWWNNQNADPTLKSETTSMTSTSRHASANSLPTILTPSFTTFYPASSTPSQTSDETAISDVKDLSFLWPTHLDLPSMPIPEVARVTITKIWDGMGVVWYLFQKVLHYPLDPP